MHHVFSRAFAAIVFCASLAGLPALAEGRTVVVELFTSQGCSSCPPADKLLHRLAERDGVVALALHVDYWDYLGWKDDFARPEHTTRQKAYARVARARTIYTPQMVIGGVDHVIGARPMEVTKTIKAHMNRPELVAVTLARRGETAHIQAERRATSLGQIKVLMVRYTPKQSVKIKRGENAGKTLSYANIVTDLREVATWAEGDPLELSLPMDGAQPLVVIFQKDGHREIVAAAELR